MRVSLKISCTKAKKLELPIHHQHIIQAFLYRNFKKEVADFLHNSGFENSGRTFKLFTFSRLIGKFHRAGGRILFENPTTLILSSPLKDLLGEFARNILKKGNLKLAENDIFVESVSIHKKPKIGVKERIRFLAPITIYSTLLKGDGKKKTYYYSPFEKEFSELAGKNLFKKYEAFRGKKQQKKEFSIKPIGTRHREKILKYRDFIIKGWLGNYEISGSRALLNFAYDAGLGAKNSQGFGMFEVIK